MKGDNPITRFSTVFTTDTTSRMSSLSIHSDESDEGSEFEEMLSRGPTFSQSSQPVVSPSEESKDEQKRPKKPEREEAMPAKKELSEEGKGTFSRLRTSIESLYGSQLFSSHLYRSLARGCQHFFKRIALRSACPFRLQRTLHRGTSFAGHDASTRARERMPSMSSCRYVFAIVGKPWD